MRNTKLINGLASQLKKARATRGWSLDVASGQTGVSKAMLGQIERGESSPTIAKLWDIANGFNLPLSYFVDLGTDDVAQVSNTVSDEGFKLHTLFTYDVKTKIEVFRLSLSPGHQHISLPHNTGVVEHLIAIEGQIDYCLEQTWSTLKCGEAVKFKADVSHGYRNITAQPAVLHNIIHYP